MSVFNNPFSKPATAQTSSTTPAFGAFATGQAGQTQPTTSPFGGAAQSTGAGTGSNLFGVRPATNLFGGTATTGMGAGTQPATGMFGGGAFGTQQQQQQQPQQRTTTNVFGMPTGGSVFGTQSATQPATGGGPFATQGTTGTQPTTNLFGGFGQAAQQQQQQQPQQQQTTNIFGQPQQQQQPSVFGGFGQSTMSTTNPFTSSLFPSTAPSAATTTTSPFTTSTTSNLFGQRPAGLGFGSSVGGGLGTSTFGGALGTSVVGTSQTQTDSAQAQFVNLVQRIEGIMQAWEPSSPNCRFQKFFYNLVEPNQVHLFGRPPNASSDAAWQKALRENPDSTCYVPALAVGFDDLQKRVEAQRQQSESHQQKVKDIQTRITTLTNSHTTTNVPRLRQSLALQTQLIQRIVRLVTHLHLLIPSIRSSSIRPEEEALRAALEEIEEVVKRGGGGGSGSGVGRLKAKLGELWAVIEAVEAAREKESVGRSGEKGEGIEWAVVDQEGLQRIAQVLAEQQAGIAHLTKIVHQHLKDLDVILGKGLDERQSEGDAFSNPQAREVLMGASLRGGASMLR